MRPRLLDLFCCEGGAAKGYADAGFDVFGVDLFSHNDENGRTVGPSRKRYPFPSHQGDAIEYVKAHGHEFDAIHASPPCQFYSITKHSHSKTHADLVGPTRDALVATGRPYVIENVVGAPLLSPLTLCGTEFSLTTTDTDGTPLYLKRHRLFESNVMLFGNGGCRCGWYRDRGWTCGGVYGGGSVDRAHAKHVRRGGYTPAQSVRAALIGVDWMTQDGLSQSIPPAYTRHVGEQLVAHLTTMEATA